MSIYDPVSLLLALHTSVLQLMQTEIIVAVWGSFTYLPVFSAAEKVVAPGSLNNSSLDMKILYNEVHLG